VNITQEQTGLNMRKPPSLASAASILNQHFVLETLEPKQPDNHTLAALTASVLGMTSSASANSAMASCSLTT
jgi:hypothetical protein